MLFWLVFGYALPARAEHDGYFGDVLGILLVAGPLFLIPGLCVYFWRLWVRPRLDDYRRNALTAEGCRVLPGLSREDESVLRASLVRFAMEVTGAPLAYLVQFTPGPVIVCHADESGIVVSARDARRTAESGNGLDVPLEAREFWSGLMVDEPYTMMEGSTPEWPNCGYPLERPEMERHLAVAMMSGRAPVVVLGVGNAPYRFSEQDAARLKTVLVTAWEYVLLRNNLVVKERESELQQSILETAPIGLAILNYHGELLSFTPAFKAIYGLHELSQVHSVFNLIRADKRHVLEDAITRVLHVGGPPLEMEMEHLRGEKSFIANVYLARLALGGEFRLLMMVNDVSDQREAQRQLELHRDKLEKMVLDRTVELQNALVFAETTRDRIDMILRSIADGLLVTDMHNRIILMNSNAELFLGVGLQDAVGVQIGQALGRMSFRNIVEEQVAQTRSGAERHFDFVTTSADGKPERYIRAASSQVRDKYMLPAGVVTIMHDASRERELDTMKSEFLSMAAHELRTPLTTIQGFSDILKNRADITEEERNRFLDLVNQNAQTLSGIVSDLLDISRIESGRGFSMNYETLDLAELTRKQVDMWGAGQLRQGTRPQDGSGEHAIFYVGPASGVDAYVDRNKYFQILENLVGNAVKYSPEGGEVAVRLETDAATILVSVTDHGMGMTAEQLDRAFEKFFRAHKDGVIQGTGLGLSIVRHLVEAHGGEVWIESKPKAGTKVSFTLPSAEVAQARL
ncbi:ATP-binding protein [Desulfovibrio mangrovi]|uniref:ATP-binding protein n=1 Tax=Desulfovibrio mangrovi TaxID=2976983 RepID=UPI0022476A73|nr:ATP-binding protein [Desulfovibrio mangrovi]UZP66403.1 ATP-binding protein [Desulfovibrio mangrovi]